MKRKLFIACIAILAVTACEEETNDQIVTEVKAITDEVSSVDMTSATVKATVSGEGITQRGVCWGETNNPTINNSKTSDGSGEGTFTATLENLTEGTAYYARAYATAGGKTVYGASKAFTTKTAPVPLSLTIESATVDIESISVTATIEGGEDDMDISERGVCYGVEADPAVEGSKVVASSAGKGRFTVEITGLTSQTTYHLRAYAISDEGILYSTDTEETTLKVEDKTTQEIFWKPLAEAKLTYGILRDENGMFVMHYTINESAGEITITYIEPDGKRDAKHITKEIAFNDGFTKASWEKVSNDNKEFSGILVNGGVFSAVGTAGLTLDQSMPQSDIYGMYVNSAYGGINRVTEIYNDERSHSSLLWTGGVVAADHVEISGEAFSIVSCPGNGGYTYHHLKVDEKGKPNIPLSEDVASFSWNGDYVYPFDWAEKDASKNAEMDAAVKSFIDYWENPDGLIIIRELKQPQEGGTINDGDFNIYSISAKDVAWAKMYLRKYGA